MGYEKWFFLLLLVVQPFAQVLEKKGMLQIGSLLSFKQAFNLGTLLKLATNWYIISGILLSIIGIILWLALLSNVKLSYISPFSALVFPVVALLSYFILGETITSTRWVGILVISVGCVLINLK